MAHLFDDIDSLGSIQGLEENTRAFEAQVHQRKVDVVVAAAAGLERILSALLAFDAQTHLLQQRARTSTLAIAAEVQFLHFVQEDHGLLGIAGHGAGLHVGDPFPGFGAVFEVLLNGRRGLDEGPTLAVGAQTGIHG